MKQEQERPSEITGVVEEILYRNRMNDYTVLVLSLNETEYVTAVGEMPFLGEGETATLHGKWGFHVGYGDQFEVSSYEKKMPEGEDAIYRYLTSGAVKGIGPATANRLLAKYGEDTLDVLEHHPDWLAEIPGISKKRAYEIGEAFAEQAGIRSVMLLCNGHFGGTVIHRIYQKWGEGAVGMIRDNPYLLCEEIDGIGFERADQMAQSLGIRPDAAIRIFSGIFYVMQTVGTQNGHICLPEEEFLSECVKRLSVPRELVTDAVEQALIDGRLLRVERPGIHYIYTKKNYLAETYVAKRLHEIARACPAFSYEDIDALLHMIEASRGITYAKDQRRAIYESLRSGITVITGGPGTGKTTVIKALLLLFSRLGIDVALAAPTGRAAMRMSEATGEEAKTVHRLLETERSDRGETRFNRNTTNPLEEKVIIIDEASMLDIFLTEALLRAMKSTARLILIGDADQLPSVGCGNVLNDIIASDCFHVVRLTEIFRQADDSLIITNAHKINRGEMPEMTRNDADFFHVVRLSDESIPTTVADLITNRLPRAYGESIREEIQVITPSRRGIAGTEALNPLLRDALNPKHPRKKELVLAGTLFREGDRVMQVKNNYDIAWEKQGQTGSGVFNGDIGILRELRAGEGKLTVDFDGRLAEYTVEQAEELEHAYAITVHKSQGNEYPVVLIPLYRCPPLLMTRNLIYTAVTRAKRMVITVGQSAVMERMVQNDKRSLRHTFLTGRLQELDVPFGAEEP